jgi:hypothetical protein
VSEEQCEKVRAKWVWSQRKEEAALEVALDKLTNPEIAALVGISPRALDKWKVAPEFMERVAQHRDAIRERICSTGYASIERRVQELGELLDRYKAVMAARAEEYGKKSSKVPGGDTGLIVRNFRVIGSGPNSRVVSEYVFDRGLSAEFRATLDDIAKEVGGRINKADVTTGGQPFKVYLTPEVDAV